MTPDGLFQPEVMMMMMMGLSNAAPTFQMIMKLKDTIGGDIAFPFLDDLITAGNSYEEQLGNIEKILCALREAKLRVRLKKRAFFMKTVEFLGFRLSEAGVQPGTRKFTTVADYPVPTNATEVRRFLGLTSFFRRFVKGYAAVSAPLTNLLRKSAVFTWTSECASAFEQLKSALLSEPVLVKFKAGRPTELHTDASAVELGAILMQKVKRE